MEGQSQKRQVKTLEANEGESGQYFRGIVVMRDPPNIRKRKLR